jgi:hypothetical protein
VKGQAQAEAGIAVVHCLSSSSSNDSMEVEQEIKRILEDVVERYNDIEVGMEDATI